MLRVFRALHVRTLKHGDATPKQQIPNPQVPAKSQGPNPKLRPRTFSALELGTSLGFGTWELGFTGNVCCYDPRLYALNVFAEQFSHSVQPLVPARLFISHAAGKDGRGQIGGGNVLETLRSLILSEKAGINMGESASKPLEKFIQKFTADDGNRTKAETSSTLTAR